MKRALATFGNQFGLALYDKDQNGVRRRPERGSLAAGVTWTLLSGTGARLSRHELPDEFCSALRELIEATPKVETLERIWGRNLNTVDHLRRAWPDLKTVNGTHYADLLQKLYEQTLERLRTVATADSRADGAQPAQQAEFMLGVSKRLRDPEHLRYVASHPCLICARMPSHAHHLRFAQPRALGSKVSDEWTVPLCFTHHRSLHDAGNEELWWQVHAVDAKVEAERLWRQTRVPRLSADTGNIGSSEVPVPPMDIATGAKDGESEQGIAPKKSAAE
jgi:hypothetical protein